MRRDVSTILVQGTLGMRLTVLLTIVAHTLCCSYSSKELYWVLSVKNKWSLFWFHFVAKKISLLKHGRIDIVQCLRDLPKTRHHPGAFSVDVIRATVSSVWCTCVCMSCREVDLWALNHSIFMDCTAILSHPWICYDSSSCNYLVPFVGGERSTYFSQCSPLFPPLL